MTVVPTAPGLTTVPLVKVMTPRGTEIEVMGYDEAERYILSRDTYLSQADYQVQSDLADLENILGMELLVHRWTTWLLAGKEYSGVTVNENELRRMIQDYTDRITKKKESLKLDRKGRESDTAQSFEQRWRQLCEHAEEFGIMRERQLDVALELMQTIFSVLGAYDRANAEERERLGFKDEAAIVAFIREQRPHFDAVDAYFRTHSQRLWIRSP